MIPKAGLSGFVSAESWLQFENKEYLWGMHLQLGKHLYGYISEVNPSGRMLYPDDNILRGFDWNDLQQLNYYIEWSERNGYPNLAETGLKWAAKICSLLQKILPQLTQSGYNPPTIKVDEHLACDLGIPCEPMPVKAFIDRFSAKG
jgi:hypothetical protein